MVRWIMTQTVIIDKLNDKALLDWEGKDPTLEVHLDKAGKGIIGETAIIREKVNAYIHKQFQVSTPIPEAS